MNVFLICPFYLNKALTKVHLGIFKIIDKSSKKLLLLDKNFITVFGELLNILKNILGIILGFLFRTLKKISGTLMRDYIKNNDKESFIDGLPQGVNGEEAWNIVTNLKEDLYDPSESDLDFMRSSEYKAGYRGKKDIPRKGAQIHNRQTTSVIYETRGGESEMHIYDFDETIARVETPIPYTVKSPNGEIIEKGETTSIEFEETKDNLISVH